MTGDHSTLSVVIPTLDEAERLPSLLRDLTALDAEIIIVDGGSRDQTTQIARAAGAHLLQTPPGRATQLRAGADAARSEWLFFLHADSRLAPDALLALGTFVEHSGRNDFGHFSFALDGSSTLHRVLETGQQLRQRLLGLVYGDQGLIVSRQLYERVGGYPEWPLMEDVGLMKRLRRAGRRRALAPVLVTSSRRYDAEGGFAAWLRNVLLMSLFTVGVPPARLARWYRPNRPRRLPTKTVIVFAKAPIAGQVKTRLAVDLGNEEALHIYRTLGRRTVDALRGGPYRLIVYVDRPDPVAIESVRCWLGSEGLDFRVQSEGDLGHRMYTAFEECLGESDSVCIVGTDIPGIDRSTVQAAFEGLSEHDLTLGPSTDGGYYLVAMQRSMRDLFTDVPWSTDSVLSTTLERAASLGVTVSLLGLKTDVDTASDVPAEFMAG